MIIYTVKKGDTLYEIGNKFGVSPKEIAEANGIMNMDILSVGQSLFIPSGSTVHQVKEGDSLYSIAMQHNIPLADLIAINPKLKPPYIIFPGDFINLPNMEPTRQIEVNGYCFPSIKEDVLKNTLPYLTYLSIFSYRLMPDGNLYAIDDDRLIKMAKDNNVAPLMVITNTDEGGGFNSETAEKFLDDDEATENFIEGISPYLKSKGYMGINLDLEYIPPSSRDDYNEFIMKLHERLSAEGLILTTAVVPKISANQMGTLYQAHDYSAHGKYSDRVILMTYEWGYLYGPPLAVAPISEVEKVLRYAVSVIPPEKILMGMPNYGYDWTLPYEKGRPARVLSLTAAVNLANSVGSEIKFSSSSAAPFFTYRDSSGADHIVWFDDPKSINARLKLIEEYNLGGVSFWTIGNFFPATFRILSSLYKIKKLI